ncbi:MFS transporter [Nocardia altamirensis]|uniref:MFS transporter n=1 Tax=Nocardia altamirensis TaxID=472158 RepID=UPI001C3F881C|nr:MFS transporter [Nocardia altamirensis]
MSSQLSRGRTLLFAIACGLAVANVYYAQPLLDLIAADFGIDHGAVGAIVTVTQIGYGAGLLLIVPLGDRLDRRRLIVGQLSLSFLALGAVTFAPSPWIMLAAMGVVGILAVVAQVIVAYSAILANPTERGRVVGTVTSGIVLGILLARVIAGSIADIGGWRAVFAVSAVATLAMALVLLRATPKETARRERLSYRRLVGSVPTLLVREPVLRVRAILAFLIFTAITTLLTPMVLPLSAPPISLSHTSIGLFGLAGAAGALGAAFAGNQADRGHGQRTTTIGLTIMLASWIPIALLPHSLWWLVLGVVAIDYGLQSVHVTNQGLIYRVRPEAQSRLTAAYMLFYSLGSATGALLSTLTYATWGWNGVCLLGATVSLTALIFWAATKPTAPEHLSTENTNQKVEFP